MQDILTTFINGYSGYAGYLWSEITQPCWHNYFYWLIGVSLFFFILEVIIPWRKDQPILRKDFWLDAFYMFFNFFLFSLVIYNALSDVIVNIFNDGVLSITGYDLKISNPMYSWPLWAIFLIGFVVRDFVQWWIHRLLHWHPRLWKFHQIHHSVKQMGFAAHLRYHWMETVVYRSIEYLPLALLGIGLYDFFIIHIFTVIIGHYNHSNISIDSKITGGILGVFIAVLCYFGVADMHWIVDQKTPTKLGISSLIVVFFAWIMGPYMKYIFNSPEMHIWHHAHDLPHTRPHGVNFGISLALWDYIFKTNYIPSDGKSITLGFPGDDDIPEKFIEQATYGILEN